MGVNVSRRKQEVLKWVDFQFQLESQKGNFVQCVINRVHDDIFECPNFSLCSSIVEYEIHLYLFTNSIASSCYFHTPTVLLTLVLASFSSFPPVSHCFWSLLLIQILYSLFVFHHLKCWASILVCLDPFFRCTI